MACQRMNSRIEIFISPETVCRVPLEEVLTLREEEEKVNSSFNRRPSSLEKDFEKVDNWT